MLKVAATAEERNVVLIPVSDEDTKHVYIADIIIAIFD